ncbi:MAG TPA: hypothetical protein VNU20_07300 [Candidatus Sulfotelmatobacter sp.]|jgi:hypothetical protein|nr:hypothetical protein [Candidatus Sulfotelmatobacter sp.]
MSGIGQFFYRTFFWSYERGSWQYDIAVILILFFVFSPKSWFHDQPQVGLPVNSTQVELVSKLGDVEVYRIDSRVLAPPERTPALQNELHNALQKAGAGLQDGRFSIGKIEALRDASGNVIAYQVEIKH